MNNIIDKKYYTFNNLKINAPICIKECAIIKRKERSEYYEKNFFTRIYKFCK